jgi:hypothetical protein
MRIVLRGVFAGQDLHFRKDRTRDYRFHSKGMLINLLSLSKNRETNLQHGSGLHKGQSVSFSKEVTWILEKRS